MAKNENNYRASCNEVNCAKSELGMPKECNVITFGEGEKMILTNSGAKGIVPEEIALGMKIEATGDKPKEQQEQEQAQASKESR